MTGDAFRNFHEYWIDLTPAEKLWLATRAKTSVNYLSQVAHGHRRAGGNIIERLQKVDHALTFKLMRAPIPRNEQGVTL